MDVLIAKLHNFDIPGEINYTDIVLELHRSVKSTRGKYINYIVHGINIGLISIDKLFHKSVVACSDVNHCFLVGLCLRMGANIHRFYNDKNIVAYIIDKYHNYNEELFVFLITMMLLKGLTYNDFINRHSASTVGDYFKSKSIQIFFPKNIRLANQRLMNLFMDKILTDDIYYYHPYELVENLNVNLVNQKVVKQETKNCEDLMMQEIIDSCNFNLFMTAFEATYNVTYFNIQRICVELRKANEDNDVILQKQLMEMLNYLQSKKIYIDEYQYTYIRDIASTLKYITTKNINAKVEQLLATHMKENENPMYTLTKLKFLPSYVYDLDEFQLDNIKCKVIHYRIEKNGIVNVMDRI